ncbi:MAG: RNase adapter RapZ [Clostridiales bacterium]|jgi:UPF0042 nucleotide-binding protein|nr:RNase adapter RapZ [Clostridiales bacterium]MDR2711977.1 RNase adapter RapZ [Clostridiales bacterium]
MDKPAKRSVVIITGMSGAGKSQAASAFEDMGYFCVDNMPAGLFLDSLSGLLNSAHNIERLAMVVDVRGGDYFPLMQAASRELALVGIDFQVIFLEAADDVIIRRYKETRRRHPLDQDGLTIVESISQERDLLQKLREEADFIVDTSNFSGREISQYLANTFGIRSIDIFLISLSSFGFKYGLPLDADLVVDVRFLPNPYYIEELRRQTGHDQEVREYVLENDLTKQFLRHYLSLLKFLLPLYIAEGKKHLAIAIGCTGGQHRSLAISEELAKRLQRQGYQVAVNHRDLKKADVDKQVSS